MARMPLRAPRFRELTPAECEEMLGRHRVGRLAYTFHGRVDVEPIGYGYESGALVFRTAPGSKLETLAHHPWVALEIDEVDGLFDWRSVVVHGTVYALEGRGSDEERRAHAAAVRSLRRLVPDSLGPGDPVPFRSVILKLHVDRMAGRAASSERRRNWKGVVHVEQSRQDPPRRRVAGLRDGAAR